MYKTRLDLEQARQRQQELSKEIAEARFKTQGALTQALEEARSR
jgi:hypothetical protein